VRNPRVYRRLVVVEKGRAREIIARFRVAVSGAAAIEFAIVSPFLVFFLLTIIYFGVYISIVSSVLQLAADGARVSVAGLGQSERRQLTVDYVHGQAEKYMLLDGERVGVDFASDAGASTVVVTYDAAPLLSWYPISFGSMIPSVIERAAVVRAGGF
jgi:Flp pilus assembly protein TadG